MKLTYDRKEGYLLDTEVENIFISEFMVTAPGEYVKVYLYALMFAEMDRPLSFSDISKQLMMSENDVRKAFLYWKERGAVDYTKDGAEDIIEFTSLRRRLFCAQGEEKNSIKEERPLKAPLYDSELADMFSDLEKILKRPLGARETSDILSWADDFGATPMLIKKAYGYCMKYHNKESSAYVGKVVKDWAIRGLSDEDSIDRHIEENERMHFFYRRVFKALGFSRNATEDEIRIMDFWFNDMNLPIDKVLDACRKMSGISNPNIKYLDKVIKNTYKNDAKGLNENGEVTAGLVLKYYDFIREKAEKEAHERCLMIYKKIPEIKELDEAVRNAGTEMGRIMVSGMKDRKAKAAAVRKKTDLMLAERAAYLTEHGYPADYTEPAYKCPLCRDTGTSENGERCSCFKDRMNEAKEWQISLRTEKDQ